MERIGLYVHWPYCTRICPYCDFNVYKNKADTQTELVAAILTDLQYWREMSGARVLSSIHFGGGTPSLLSAKNMQRIIDTATGLWDRADNLEIGLEANPCDISKTGLEKWRSAGIERLSIGVQSFDNDVLAFLGRDHNGQQSLGALTQAVDIMPRVSADLIYGWAGQNLEAWRQDLDAAIGTGVSHISAYQLSIEERTAFARSEMRGKSKAVDSDLSADLYELGVEVLSNAGFAQYEVSNFATTKTARSRHNLLYWQGGDYIGVGPGAHGRITKEGVRAATICARKPQNYTAHVNRNGHGMVTHDLLDTTAWGQEYILMGLRISSGISLRRFEDISGQSLNPDTLNNFIHAGLLACTDDSLAATHKGRLVLDYISHELLLA